MAFSSLQKPMVLDDGPQSSATSVPAVTPPTCSVTSSMCSYLPPKATVCVTAVPGSTRTAAGVDPPGTSAASIGAAPATTVANSMSDGTPPTGATFGLALTVPSSRVTE